MAKSKLVRGRTSRLALVTAAAALGAFLFGILFVAIERTKWEFLVNAYAPILVVLLVGGLFAGIMALARVIICRLGGIPLRGIRLSLASLFLLLLVFLFVFSH